jgi:hypothetical protein
MLNVLASVLRESGKASEVFHTSDGSRLLILPYGARVFGLFSGKSEDNFFWTNPALHQTDTAKHLFACDGWHNTGGDRTWIAPELDTFFPEGNSSRYWQPRPLDMSEYAVEHTGGGIQLSREMTLPLSRSKTEAHFRLSKWFGPAAHPLRHEREMASALDQVEYAGYTQRVTIQSLQTSGEPAKIGIWNLMQLPEGGDMLVPLYSETTPQKCFGDIPAGHVVLEDRLLRVNKANFAHSHKIAVKAAALCGRTGYVYSQGDRWSLAIRNFFVNLSGDYIDVQWSDEQDFGYAFQMCRVDEPEFGSFCEMEYHAPALGLLPDPTRSEDTSQVWAFRGCRDAIDAIARKLLGVTL